MKDFISESDARFDKEFPKFSKKHPEWHSVSNKSAYQLLLHKKQEPKGNGWILISAREDIKSFLHAELERYGNRLLDMVEEGIEDQMDKGNYNSTTWPKETQIEVDGWNGAIRASISRLSEIRKGINS